MMRCCTKLTRIIFIRFQLYPLCILDCRGYDNHSPFPCPPGTQILRVSACDCEFMGSNVM